MTTLGHLTEAQVVLLVKHRLSGSEKTAVLVHLSDCHQCSETVAALNTKPWESDSAAMTDVPPSIHEKALALARSSSGSTPWYRSGRIGWITAAAAVVAAVTLLGPFGNEEPDRFRSTEPGSTLLSLTPADAAQISSSAPTLAWSAVPGANGYRCVVFQASGVELLSKLGTDTLLILDRSGLLEPGKQYLWRVEAFLPDARVLRSDLHTFRYDPVPAE
jgi:hypothetical protein